MSEEKVLIVEDDEIARKKIGNIVEKEGFTVFLATNGVEGLELFKKEKPDIIISDLKMPQISGLEFVHTAKRLNPSVQIILVTGYGDVDTVISAIREGVIDYIRKPIDIDQLCVALGRAKEKLYESNRTVSYPTILVMEDDEATRKMLVRVLEKENLHVLDAANGVLGLEIFENHKVDLALIDIQMPQKNGLETLHEMKKMTKDFEALILTGYGDENSAIQAMRDGAINFLRKPIDLDHLSMSIKRALEKLNLERALKHRTRELELTKQIIAKVTADEKIFVDTSYHPHGAAKKFGAHILDNLPVNLMVIDKSLDILYINDHAKNVLKAIPEKFNKEIIEQLVGNEMDSNSFIKKINQMFQSSETKVESIELGKNSFITITQITFVEQEKTQNVVLIISRK